MQCCLLTGILGFGILLAPLRMTMREPRASSATEHDDVFKVGDVVTLIGDQETHITVVGRTLPDLMVFYKLIVVADGERTKETTEGLSALINAHRIAHAKAGTKARIVQCCLDASQRPRTPIGGRWSHIVRIKFLDGELPDWDVWTDDMFLRKVRHARPISNN